MRGLVALFPFFAVSVYAQAPFIFTRGVVNAASFETPGLPGGAIARGSIFSIFGKALGPATSPALAFPLSTTLGGVSITATQGATTVNVIPLVVTSGQINAVMPSNTPAGMVSIRVTYNGQTSNPAPVRVVSSTFGIYSVNIAGFGPGVIQATDAAGHTTVNSPAQPAQPGQTLVMWGTGLGAGLGPDNVAPATGNLPTATEVFVGGVAANVVYHGRSSCCAGDDQINFIVPANAPTGCWVPVMVRTEGQYVGNSVTMAISADGKACSDPANPFSAVVAKGGKMGAILAVHQDVIQDIWVLNPAEPVSDSVLGFITQQKGGPFPYNRIFSLPPPGACTVATAPGILAGSLVSDYLGGTAKFLDSGAPWSVSTTGPEATSQAVGQFFNPGGVVGHIGYSIAQLPSLGSSILLNPGKYTISAPGGVDVPPFQASFTMPSMITWASALSDPTIIVDRTQPLTIGWSGITDPSYTGFVAGGSFDAPTASTAIFFCLAPQGATSFTVPSAVLAALPASRSRASQSVGAVYAGAWNLSNPATFSATGLDFAAVISTMALGRTVVFQ